VGREKAKSKGPHHSWTKDSVKKKGNVPVERGEKKELRTAIDGALTLKPKMRSTVKEKEKSYPESSGEEGGKQMVAKQEKKRLQNFYTKRSSQVHKAQRPEKGSKPGGMGRGGGN